MQTTPKTYTEGTITRIPLKLIVESDEIKYRDLDKAFVGDLSKDIERNGLDVPLIVWNGGGETGKQVVIDDAGTKVPASYLVAGRHRRSAIKELGKRNPERYKELFSGGVPVIVRGGDLKDALSAQLRENVKRNDMKNEEVFPVITRLRDEFGMKQKDIARAIGKSESWVSQVFDVESTLGAEGAEALKSGDATLTDTREAAANIKAKRKKGEAVDVKAEVDRVKAKKAKLKASNRQREEKKVSAKKLWARYSALPNAKMGQKVAMLESALAYLAGAEGYETLPDDLAADAEADTKSEE